MAEVYPLSGIPVLSDPMILTANTYLQDYSAILLPFHGSWSSSVIINYSRSQLPLALLKRNWDGEAVLPIVLVKIILMRVSRPYSHRYHYQLSQWELFLVSLVSNSLVPKSTQVLLMVHIRD
jgi:hypothetical protein